MATKPAAVWKTVKKEGAVVVTRNGQPEGVFIATSGETWLEDIQEIIFARARKAAQDIRMAAAKSGASELSMDAINAEIKAARAQRKA